jgi:hypothetical protein
VIVDFLKESPTETEARRQQGLRNVERFQPERMIAAYINLYQKTIADHSTSLCA